MMTLPLVLRGNARPFVVIGAGNVAARKIRTLVNAGAKVKVIAPSIHQDIQALAHTLELEQREATSQEHFEAGSFVVLATANTELNATLAKRAKEQGALVCRVDEPEDNDFSFPAVIDRSPLMVTVSTQGASPALTRHVKQRLEAFLPSDYGKLASYMEGLRERIKESLPLKERAGFWRKWINSIAPELLLGRKDEQVESITQDLLAGKEENGEVWLVGAGPGDPDLLTFRALRLIQKAEVVYYDRLVNPRILDLLSPEAEKFYVGKAQSNHAVPQEGINELLAQSAKAGKKVLRLKGGDPFIFGRGGEEIEHLAAQGIPFQVVPGITAANGCAAYAGIPLTHRNHAQSVRFVTGHLKNNTCNLPWHELVHPNQTLVIYMGLTGVPYICEQLIANGMNADTPIALVEKGTLPEQKVHIKTLKTMPAYVATHDISAPTLTIVGTVVSLYEQLKWR
ncbi:MAG: siroheme synthase CysG [Venatoribacter sp.]